MRRILLIALLCLFAVVSNSCKKARLRGQLKELIASTIVLPERIRCVYNGDIFPMPDYLRHIPKLIIYVDSTECTTCRISNIGRYHQFFQLSEEKGLFEVMLLFPDIEVSGISVEKYVLDSNVWYPIYFDIDNKFLELNPSVASDNRLHALLVDEAGTPLYVGDPSASRELFQIFLGTVDKLTNKIRD